jgi:hypothetical protein
MVVLSASYKSFVPSYTWGDYSSKEKSEKNKLKTSKRMNIKVAIAVDGENLRRE